MNRFTGRLFVLCLWAGVIVISSPAVAVDIPTDTSVGTWDPDTRIYTLADDVELADDSLNIVDSDLTLDGNARTVTGVGTEDWYGVRSAVKVTSPSGI